MARGYITSGRPSESRGGVAPVTPREYSINDGAMVRDIVHIMRNPAPVARTVRTAPLPALPDALPDHGMGVIRNAKRIHVTKRLSDTWLPGQPHD